MAVPDVQLTGGVADQVQGVSSLPDAAYSSRDTGLRVKMCVRNRGFSRIDL